MAFRMPRIFFLAPGATMRVDFHFGNPGEDRGTVVATAHPLAGEPPTNLVTERLVKRVDCDPQGQRSTEPPTFFCNAADAFWRYAVDVRNEGRQGCRFQIEGGGVN